jgi:hypothetical protein
MVDEHREHRHEVKFGLKYLLISKLNQKARGYMLMTKVDKSYKLDYPISHFKLSDFNSFRAKPRMKLNLKI